MTEEQQEEPGGLVPDAVDDGSQSSDPLTAMLGGGGLDLGAMMQAAQSMQEQMSDAQQQLVEARVTGTAGGGLVKVTLNGHLHMVEVRIDPDAVDPDDPSILEDLIQAAWQAAHDQVAELQRQADPMSGLLGGSGEAGGLLGGLGDLLGGL